MSMEERITIRLPAKLYQQLAERSLLERRTVNNLVRVALEDFLGGTDAVRQQAAEDNPHTAGQPHSESRPDTV